MSETRPDRATPDPTTGHPCTPALARRALACLDLTDLSDACTEARVEALCLDALANGVAAVCVWPQFVALCAARLAGTGPRIATVVNFPAGGEDAERAADDAAEAVREGAHEIDLVLPYRAVLRGDAGAARAVVEAVRDACPRALLKVILETGEIGDPGRIAEAGDLALAAGADFLKTSTGKTPVSATPEAASALLGLLARHGRGGLKVSGGIRAPEDAAHYLGLADRALGPGWASPATFRIGASALLGALAALRDGA